MPEFSPINVFEFNQLLKGIKAGSMSESGIEKIIEKF